MFVKARAAGLAAQKQLAPFDSKKRDKKEAQVMVDSF
jgi:hypothetical protein